MRSKRALWPLIVPVLACAGIFALVRPVPLARAAQDSPAPSRAPTPADCRPLPLPSELAFRKSEYEALLGRFLRAGCWAGWHHDSQLRPTGPTVAGLGGDPHFPSWVTTTLGTHNTVVVYYSPDVYRWMCEGDAAHERKFVAECRKSCPTCRLDAIMIGKEPIKPIADGSMILKLMYGNTTAERLQNPAVPAVESNMIALMVRDRQASKDGWYWGSWDPQATEASQLDWPPPANLPYPWMGFGYYCLNCHASAKSESTFSSLNNVIGNPDTFVKFYFQDQPPIAGEPKQPAIETLSAHERFEPLQDLLSKVASSGAAWNKIPWPNPKVLRVSQPYSDYSPAFLKTFGAHIITPPGDREITGLYMPPEVYDHAFAGPDNPPLFLTSDQCVGCHAAGSTGLHYDMTVQQANQPAYTNLLNLAPYGEWRGSPMGLAGRDPIFFSQLETEQTVHPALAKLVPDVCLHCHGVMGQRQFCLDQFKGRPQKGERGLQQHRPPRSGSEFAADRAAPAVQPRGAEGDPLPGADGGAEAGFEVRRPRPRRRVVRDVPPHRDRRQGADRPHLHRRLQGRRRGVDPRPVRRPAAGADGSHDGGQTDRVSADPLVEDLRLLPQRGAAGVRRRQAVCAAGDQKTESRKSSSSRRPIPSGCSATSATAARLRSRARTATWRPPTPASRGL